MLDSDEDPRYNINEPGSAGRVFPVGKNGSRLLVTTRDENVAKLADARVTPLTLKFLSLEVMGHGVGPCIGPNEIKSSSPMTNFITIN